MSTGYELVQEENPRIWRVTNGVFPANCYICEIGTDKGCLLIDPGLGGDAIAGALAELALKPKAILCTHGHFDHTGSANRFATEYGCRIYLHEADRKALKASNFLLMAFKIPERVELPSSTEMPDMDAPMDLNGLQVQFHLTPGHSPGSCVITVGDALFSGDTLFTKGIGLSKLPGEEPEVLRKSVNALLDAFPEDVIVHPGHGGSASLGWIKENNIALQNFLHAPHRVEAG